MSIRFILFLFFCFFVSIQSFRKGPVWIMLLLIFIYFLNPEIYIWGIEQYRIVFVLNIILLISIIYHYKRIDIGGDKESIWMLLLLGSFFLSALTARVSQDAAFEYATIFLKGFIFWIALKNIMKNDFQSIDMFLWGSLISLTLLALWGIQQYTLGNIRLENFGGGQIMGSNQIASAFIWILPVAYYKMVSETKWKQYISLGCLFTILAAIVCTQSRQAFVALIFYLLCAFITSQKKVILIIGFVVVALLATPLIPDDYFKRIQTIGDYTEDASATGRLDMWKAAIDVFWDYPLLGVGGRNFFHVAPWYSNDHVRVTHNTYFQILSEEGIIGFTFFSVLVLSTLFSLRKLSLRFKPPSRNVHIYYFSMTALMSFAGVLICCIFQNKAEHEFLYWPAAISSALITWSNQSIKEINHENHRKTREELTR